MNKSKEIKLKTKRIFLKKGTCSRAMFYILDREFGNPMDEEEQAVDPLAGGILQQGYQCGLLWGTSMAIGAEAYRRYDNIDNAIGAAIKGTQLAVKHFTKTAKTIECSEITDCNFKNKWSFFKYMASGRFLSCFKLAEKWAPKSIKVAKEGLSINQIALPEHAMSCASEVIKKMGGTDKEAAMVAGLAGGMGLSGSGCGALAAAIWKTVLELVKKDNWKTSFNDPITEKILNKFYEATDYEMECKGICGKTFNSIEEHTEFIKNGGCSKLISILSNNYKENFKEEPEYDHVMK